MGAVESRNGNNSDDDSDGEDWMQADKYAEWECAVSLIFQDTTHTMHY